MMNRVKEGIYWVGAVDWSIRSFHSYITHRGSSYNSYLVVDEKVALIDFVKAPFAEEQIRENKRGHRPKEGRLHRRQPRRAGPLGKHQARHRGVPQRRGHGD